MTIAPRPRPPARDTWRVAETRALARRDWLALASVLGLALLLRLAYLAVVLPMPIRSDASGYDAGARRLLATGGFAFPVGGDLWRDDMFDEAAWTNYLARPRNAWTMPGYTLFVAGVYRLAGTGSTGPAAVRTVQASLGVLSVALIFFIADRTLGRRAAWWAAVLAACYPPSIWATEYLLTETLFTVLVLGQLALMVAAARLPRLVMYLALGIATAAAVYVRPVATLVPLPLVALEVVRWWRAGPAREPLVRVAGRWALVGLAVLLLMAPWWIRNHRVYGRFIATTSAAALPRIQGETIVRHLPFPTETIPQLTDLSPYGNDDHAMAEQVSARIARSMPRATAAEIVAAQAERVRMLVAALTSPFNFFSTPAPVFSWQFAMQIAILALAWIGLWHHRREDVVIALLLGVPACFIAVHWIVAIIWSRYLYPIMPIVLALAGAGVVALRPRRLSARSAR